jgi:hypothetical protein
VIRVIARLNFDERKRKLQRLALIKERYRKLVLEPKKQIELEIHGEVEPEFEFEFEYAN